MKRIVTLFHGEIVDCRMVYWSIGEYTSNVDVSSPQVVSDDLAATEVINVKAQLTIAFIRLEHWRVGVCSQVRFST